MAGSGRIYYLGGKGNGQGRARTGGSFEKECGGLLVVTGVWVRSCAHNWRLPLEQVPGKAGGKRKERKEILLSAGKKRLRATHFFLMQSYR